VKIGYMKKRGFWNTGFKRRYFRLYSDRTMDYRHYMGAAQTKGTCDLSNVSKMVRSSPTTFEVTTSGRIWEFMCSESECDGWFEAIRRVCDVKRVSVKGHALKAKNKGPGVSGYDWNNGNDCSGDETLWGQKAGPPPDTEYGDEGQGQITTQ